MTSGAIEDSETASKKHKNLVKDVLLKFNVKKCTMKNYKAIFKTREGKNLVPTHSGVIGPPSELFETTDTEVKYGSDLIYQICNKNITVLDKNHKRMYTVYGETDIRAFAYNKDEGGKEIVYIDAEKIYMSSLKKTTEHELPLKLIEGEIERMEMISGKRIAILLKGEERKIIILDEKMKIQAEISGIADFNFCFDTNKLVCLRNNTIYIYEPNGLQHGRCWRIKDLCKVTTEEDGFVDYDVLTNGPALKKNYGDVGAGRIFKQDDLLMVLTHEVDGTKAYLLRFENYVMYQKYIHVIKEAPIHVTFKNNILFLQYSDRIQEIRFLGCKTTSIH